MLDQANSQPDVQTTDFTNPGAATAESAPIALAPNHGLWGPYDAKYCLSDPLDEERPQERCRRLAQYLKTDGPLVLRAIADSLDRQLDEEGRQPVFHPGDDPGDPPLEEDSDEFSDTDVVMAALKSGNMSATPAFLREISDLLRGLGEALDANSAWPLRLEGKHRKRGKPTKTLDQLSEHEAILEDLKSERKAFGGKLEAAVAAVASKHRISRSKVFRVLGTARKAAKPRLKQDTN
jgi:hypothetical protein